MTGGIVRVSDVLKGLIFVKKNAIRSAVCAALMGATALVPGVISTASAQDHGAQIVTFGDSFTANGGADPARTTPPNIDWNPQCRTDNNNWPKVAARDLGKTIADYSCNGTFGITAAAYLETAIQKGDLGPATEEVVLMVGGLDPLFYVDAAGNLANAESAGGPFQELVRVMQNRVREVAPNARFSLSSYTRLTDEDKICPALGQGLPVPGSSDLETRINGTIANTAKNLGAHFVDVYSASAGHSPCAAPQDRWVVIIPDPTSPSVMPNHPTDSGHLAIGKVVADGLRR